ncbi:MAG: flagellar hook-basal body complex protein FliE [Lachnospiraceae bacterium]|jgi:flagellar hook-basal body complex protein FliE|nr:flagellar hook-basal body complex protein FliE [Lachnospiraceae bacterium]
MDIGSLYHVSSGAVREAAKKTGAAKKAEAAREGRDIFSTVLNNAMDNLHTTNSYISDMENEEMRIALGQAENTHDLSIAMQKASSALQYTVAVRDKFMEAYKEIMQMQI